MIDLAIIGGGPAGTAAAIEASRQGLRVSILDRGRFPRSKVCGEFLSSESLPLLATYIPDTLDPAPWIRCAEFISPSGRKRFFTLPSEARGLSRQRMDEALWNAAGASGAELRAGEKVRRAQSLESSPTAGLGWRIETGSGATVDARDLIVACGRWWSIEGLPSPSQGRNRSGENWVGVKAHFRGVAPRGAIEMYYFRGGYCGLAPIEDGIYNACCLLEERLLRRGGDDRLSDFAAWISSVARHPSLDARLARARQEGRTLAVAPLRPERRCSEIDNVLLAGDAAGFLDPFTGDGIAMALESGRLAARIVARRQERATRRSSGDPPIHEVIYSQRLERAVARSYTVAGWVRRLVRAPASIQQLAAAALPRFGPRLYHETRWKGERQSAF